MADIFADKLPENIWKYRNDAACDGFGRVKNRLFSINNETIFRVLCF
ncbi:hypothetical protein HMPREF9098_0950 [Kingella denitrificans ATCC 33394]|uniref:Uncharacterized protein n=1 Tax=Kingella denitrificans ATCC 33394 TaxID=888741 RepID=F0EYL6_9NEIS|nr:hypothetical protein HMPREF9098_0950 [Kingella denitrificans ATCC 33394]